ncbi:MAG: PH domain-containing protein, partial [Bacteroidota bacterium]
AASTIVNRKQIIYVPGCYADQVNTVRQTYFPREQQLSFRAHSISPLIVGRRTLYYGGLPVPILLLISWGQGLQALLWLLWIPLVYFYCLYYYRSWVFEVSEEGLRMSKGIIGQDAALLQWYKVQTIDLQQSIYQRRKNLANLRFYTAGGSISLPYIELHKAQALMDYVLYRIETDQRRWM